MNPSAIALLSVVLAACATDTPELSENAHLIKIGAPGIDDDGGMCPSWGCGSNSPVVYLERFFDLHELGEPNAQGYRLTSFQKEYPAGSGTWRNFKPRVRNGILTAWTNGGTIGGTYYPPVQAWAGSELINMRFVITTPDGGPVIHIYISAIDDAVWFVHPPTMQQFGAPNTAKTYLLTWNSPTPGVQKTRVPVCGQSTDDDGVLPFHAVLFEEDRVDADQLRVTHLERNWFNIGCKGHTLAKLHLFGRTKAAQFWLGATTSLNERTALIKLLAGDYCGNGNAFTVAGVPLQIRDRRNWYNDVTNLQLLEAKWTENGATCLNVPRYDFQGYYGNFIPDVETNLATSEDGWCTPENPRPPPCTGLQDPFYSLPYFISVNDPT